MKINADLKLRKLGSKYIIVQASSDCVDMSNVYTMNSTAAYLWNRCAEHPENEVSASDFAGWLFEEYEIDPSVAASDAARIFATWVEMGLLR